MRRLLWRLLAVRAWSAGIGSKDKTVLKRVVFFFLKTLDFEWWV